MPPDAAAKQAHAAKNEYETVQHFQKCHAVLSEFFKEFDGFQDILPNKFKFLDLGCAPGGFSAFLLEDRRCSAGFGVSLPALKGGFPMRLRSDSFFLQQADLFEILPDDLIASEVSFCVCDAHYLRNSISSYERYRGIRCRSRQHGVWALLCKQFWLALSKMLSGGVLVFRFGWHDRGDDSGTSWYRKCTLRLFSLMHDLFEGVQALKSDKFNLQNNSFYVACTKFRADRFAERGIAQILGSTFHFLVKSTVDDPTELDILAAIDRLPGVRTEEVDAKINGMLDHIQKLHVATREMLEKKWRAPRGNQQSNPDAVVFLTPVPAYLTPEQLQEQLRMYGWVEHMDVNEQASLISVRYADVRQAREACAALRLNPHLGGCGIQVWLQEENQMAAGDQWQTEDWAAASQPYAFSNYASPMQGMSGLPQNGGYAAAQTGQYPPGFAYAQWPTENRRQVVPNGSSCIPTLTALR